MADGNFELDDKHFTAAGITADTPNNPLDTGGNETTSGTDTQSGTETTAASSAPDKIEGAPGKDSISVKPDSGKEQGKEKKGPDANTPELKEGDLKLSDGSIVKAGAERRHFESARMFRAENIALKADINTANQKYGTLETKYNELSNTIKQIGLENPQSVSSAVRLYKDLGSDPVGTVTKLLAELKAKGYNFEGIGGAVDTAAITTLLDQKLQSSEKPGQQQQSQEQVDADIAEEVTSFVKQFPDALIHEQMIASVIEVAAAQGEQTDLRTVYFKLRQAAINQGLDWSKPLGPQIEAKKAAAANPQQQQQQQQTKPVVSGRGGVGVAPTETIDPMKAGGNESKDDIILAAMREGGYNYER